MSAENNTTEYQPEEEPSPSIGRIVSHYVIIWVLFMAGLIIWYRMSDDLNISDRFKLFVIVIPTGIGVTGAYAALIIDAVKSRRKPKDKGR